jgi:hypothetical protein
VDEGGQGVGEEDTLVKEGTREEKKTVGVKGGRHGKEEDGAVVREEWVRRWWVGRGGGRCGSMLGFCVSEIEMSGGFCSVEL